MIYMLFVYTMMKFDDMGSTPLCPCQASMVKRFRAATVRRGVKRAVRSSRTGLFES